MTGGFLPRPQLYDAETNRVDVRQGPRPAGEALVGFTVGQVVLTKVATVGPAERT